MQEYIEEHFQLDNDNKKNLIIFLSFAIISLIVCFITNCIFLWKFIVMYFICYIFLYCFFPKEIIVKSNNNLLIITLLRYYKKIKTEYIVNLTNTIEFKEQKVRGQIYELIFIEKDKKINIRLHVLQYRKIRNFIFQCLTANNIKLTVLKSL